MYTKKDIEKECQSDLSVWEHLSGADQDEIITLIERMADDAFESGQENPPEPEDYERE